MTAAPAAVLLAAWALAASAPAVALTPADVLLLANRSSPVSRSIAEYYARARSIPRSQALELPMPDSEEISRGEFDRSIAAPVKDWLLRRRAVDRILVIVTTLGVPLKIRGSSGRNGEAASVDSELAAIYLGLKGRQHPLPGPFPNPYFNQQQPFRHPDFPMYLVARLGAYGFQDVRAMIDRSLAARNRGVVVLDLKSFSLDDGDLWLKSAARLLPARRVVLDETAAVVKGVSNVIGYASWGSNDRNRRERGTGFTYLPGALAAEFVSTDGRTLREPPADWTLGSWDVRATHFAGSPQSLAADFIRQGATAATAHVYEPYLQYSPRPQILFPQYLAGRTLAESFYASIPAISWMNILLGDPLCRLQPE